MNNAKKMIWKRIGVAVIFHYLALSKHRNVFLLFMSSNYKISKLLIVTGFVLLAISVILRNRMLFAIGAVAEAVSAVFLIETCYDQIQSIMWFAGSIAPAAPYVLSFVACIIIIVSWGLLLCSILQNKNTRLYFIIAICMQFIGQLFWGWTYKFILDINYIFIKTMVEIIILCTAITIAYLVLTGVSVDFISNKTNLSSNNTHTDTQIEKLTRLKELLDMDIITQEEFDAKKKELLNL